MNAETDWTVYRTRFVVRARQLTDSIKFTDALGRQQSGQPGDYLVEIFDGLLSITPRKFFEDIYVPLDSEAGIAHAHMSDSLNPAVLREREKGCETARRHADRHPPAAVNARGSPLNHAASLIVPGASAPLLA